MTNIPTEFQEQVAFLNWFELSFPGVRIFAIPNGTRTNIRSAIKAKQEGVKKGVPDLYVPEWKLWIEMKRIKRSSTSRDQKDWHEYLINICKDAVIIGKGWQDASSQVVKLINLDRNLPVLE